MIGRMMEPPTLIAICLVFLLAGAVKGVIGLGLPTVSLALLTALLDLPAAMALLIIPSFVTNVVQALSGGSARTVLVRIWPFLAAATATVWLGATALTRVDTALLSALLGVLLIAYASIGLAGLRLTIPARREVWAGPVFGMTNGILTGMTGSFVVPGVMFLQALGLPRDGFIQAMGMLFTASTVALALALRSSGLLAGEQTAASAIALAPALLGMAAGRAIRASLSEARFRQVFFTALLGLGLYIIWQAAG